MGLFSNLFNKKNEDAGKQNDKIIMSSEIQQDENEITAVISSVLASMDEEETVAAIIAAIVAKTGISTDNFIVRNIKRTPELDSIWSIVGRMKLMR